jgi:UDP-N-acetyl-D-glucosamine dehydrogenase
MIEQLLTRYKTRQATVAVIGLGYVGLPLVRALLDAGFKALGLDIDESKIEALKSGRSYISQQPAAFFQDAFRKGSFVPSADFSLLREADAILICVPTPLTRYREPDLGFVEKTTNTIADHLRPGQLIVLESTTYPGTTRDLMKPILERSGFKSGVDFYLAYSPEREDPGNANFSTVSIPKVIGGDGDAALDLADALYSGFVRETVRVSSVETAEAVKLTENIFRAVNIALANELKIVYEAMQIDVWDVIDAAKTKPFGYMPFYPGPGLGGHCIPIDPFYLTWKAREYELSTRFIELAGEINTSMPNRVVARFSELLDRQSRKALSGARVLIVGVAYKKNVDDTRESPALKIIDLIEARGAFCDFHDPWIECIPETREHPHLAGRRSVPLSHDLVSQKDAVLIVTDHDNIDYRALVDSAKLVVDTRNVCARVGAHASHVMKA